MFARKSTLQKSALHILATCATLHIGTWCAQVTWQLVCTCHMGLGVRRCTSGVLLSTKLASTQLTGSAPTLYFWVGRNFWQKLTKAWNLPFIIMRLVVHFHSIVHSWCFDPESNCTCSFQMMLILRLKRHFCNNIRKYLMPHFIIHLI